MFRANFVWDLPDLRADDNDVMKAIALVLNDWQFSGIWSGSRRAAADQQNSPAYTVAQGYQNGGGSVNLTGSPDYGARIIVVGDPGKGCSDDPVPPVQHRGVPGPGDEQRRAGVWE